MLLGEWTVDVKLKLMVLTDEPGNITLYRKVLRSNTHKRSRGDNSRFSGPITANSLNPRDMKDGGENPDNWLGWEWFEKLNNAKYPSMAHGPNRRRFDK